MPEPQVPSSACPVCGSTDYAPEVMTLRDGTISEGWFRCTGCKRYTVNAAPGTPLVPTYTKTKRRR